MPGVGDESVLLRLENVHKHFKIDRGRDVLRAVDGVNLDLYEGETLGIVGESGSGKTTLARIMLMLEHLTDGRILFRGSDVYASHPAKEQYARSIQAVFQDPYSSLSPRMKVWQIVGEPLLPLGYRRIAIRKRVREAMERVGLNLDQHGESFPHEFSGGQRQRIAIARSLVADPSIVILDEPTSALDVSIRAQILNLLADLKEHEGVTFVLISHDLSAVSFLADRIAIMYAGVVVEIADQPHELYARPAHPFTQALMSAVLEPGGQLPAYAWTEEQSDASESGALGVSGCKYRRACPSAHDRCDYETPTLVGIEEGRRVACHLFTAEEIRGLHWQDI